jgi:hypothetical protein
MEPRFEQFIRERKYYTSVTPATVEWYRRCVKWLTVLPWTFQHVSPSHNERERAPSLCTLHTVRYPELVLILQNDRPRKGQHFGFDGFDHS